MTLDSDIARLKAEVRGMRSLLAKVFTPDGQLRTDGSGTNETGVTKAHDHGGDGEGELVAFLPTVYADWENSVPPGGLQGALDQLAERLTDHVPLTIPAVTMEMTGMEE